VLSTSYSYTHNTTEFSFFRTFFIRATNVLYWEPGSCWTDLGYHLNRSGLLVIDIEGILVQLHFFRWRSRAVYMEGRLPGSVLVQQESRWYSKAAVNRINRPMCAWNNIEWKQVKASLDYRIAHRREGPACHSDYYCYRSSSSIILPSWLWKWHWTGIRFRQSTVSIDEATGMQRRARWMIWQKRNVTAWELDH